MSLPFWVLKVVTTGAVFLVAAAVLVRYAWWRESRRRAQRRKGYILGR